MVMKLEQLKELFKENLIEGDFPYTPKGRTISAIVLRTTQSEAIFRTDGDLNKETVSASLKDPSPITRVVVTKRKLTASERRSGREFFRELGVIPEDCSINKSMCGQCVDCLTYGFAAGDKDSDSKGSMKSRVITDNSYSLLEASQISDIKTFNATGESGTMYDLEEDKQRQSINSDEYVRPQSHFIDIETFKDLRFGEFLYAFGNILRTSRYGATPTRIGKINNTIVAIILSNGEVFSSLELTKGVWDRLEKKEHPLNTSEVEEKTLEVTVELADKLPFKTTLVTGEKLQEVIESFRQAYKEPKELKAIISELSSWKKNDKKKG